MEERILVGVITLAFIAGLRHRLLLAVRDPTPGGAVILTSMAYLVGATIVHWRMHNGMSGLVYAVCAVFFLVYLTAFWGCSVFFGLYRKAPEAFGIPSGNRSGNVKWVFLLITLMGCIAVTYVTEADRLIAALFRFVAIGDATDSVMELRLGLSSGEGRWMAPGYVKQLRDILMPLAGLLVLLTITRRTARFLLLSLTLVPVIALLMISSGQRGPVLLFLMAVFYGVARTIKRTNLSATIVVAPLVVAGVVAVGSFFVLTSSFISRAEYGDSNTILIFLDRVVTRVPEENVLGATVWGRGAPFPGVGWLSEVASVLPGTQKTLSNLIMQELGGSDMGNSPLGIWVDVYYNFGWWLGLVAAFFVGLFVAFFNHWVNAMRARSWSADMCGLWISICMLMVLSPFGFLLYGPFLLSAFLWLITRLDEPGANAAVRTRHSPTISPVVPT